MKTSARNQFVGHVTRVARGAVNGEVQVAIAGGDEIVSIITNGSIDWLGLAVGGQVTALVKASSIIVQVGGEGARTSARNRLCGTVTTCREGAVNGEVVITLPGGTEVVAIITNESIRKLGLALGVAACALIKASNVILAVSE